VKRISREWTVRVVLSIAVLIVTGCAAAPKKEEARVFYPEPPSLPYIQYLTSYTGAVDIESPKSPFDIFLTGESVKKKLDKPYGVAIYDRKIYVCDTNQTVMIFDFSKKTFRPLQAAQTGLGKVQQPLNISIDANGNKLVTDPVGGRVVMFDKNDLYVKAFTAEYPWKPVDAIAYEGLVYVADIKNFEVAVFDMNSGELVKKIGKDINKPEETLGLPTNLAMTTDGHLYVSDAGRFQLVQYDRDGHYIGTIGKLGSATGDFARPRGIAIDRQERIYTVDAAFDNVQVFSPDGQLLLFFGKGGIGPGDLYLPAKIVIDYDNVQDFQQFADPSFQIEYIIIVTSQFGNRMVNVYGFGKEKGKKYPTDADLKQQLIERLKKKTESEKPTGEGEIGK
jgi:sugar lactone lactonase YvrE